MAAWVNIHEFHDQAAAIAPALPFFFGPGEKAKHIAELEDPQMEWNHHTTHMLAHFFCSAAALWLTSKVVPGIRLRGLFSTLLATFGIGLANATLWPLLFFLTLPINILTLGLFTFVVNGATLKICAALLPGFQIKSWWSAIFGWIVLSVLATGLHLVLA